MNEINIIIALGFGLVILIVFLRKKNSINNDTVHSKLSITQNDLEESKKEIINYRLEIVKLKTELEAERNSKNDLKNFKTDILNQIKEGSSDATKPVVTELQAQYTLAKVKITAYEKKDEELQRRETELISLQKIEALKSKFSNNVRGLNGERVLRDKLEILGYHSPKMVEYNKNQEGISGNPDATIKLPHGKKLIIDAKTLPDVYNEIIDAGNEGNDAKVNNLKKDLAKAAKRHIDSLAAAEYHKAKNSFPYIIMFLPTEWHVELVREQSDIYKNMDVDTYARNKNIILCGPNSIYPHIESMKILWSEYDSSKAAGEVLTVLQNGFNSIRLVTQKLLIHNEKIDNVVESGKSLNTTIFKNLTSVSRKAKELGFSQVDIDKTINDEEKIKDINLEKISESSSDQML